MAIGRAVVRNARLYLFDEPLSNLDAQLRDEMRGEIKRLHLELGKTMIYVTHDQIEAMTMADRIVLLRDGKIEQQGAPLDLYERPKTRYVAGFLGSPSMNFIPVNLIGSGNGLAIHTADGVSLALPADRVPRYAAYRDKSLTVGVRPEHISRATDAHSRDGVVHHEVTVDLIQPTGSRTYATFMLGGIEAVAELKAHDVSQVNEKVTLAIDMNRVVLIDPQTEQVL